MFEYSLESMTAQTDSKLGKDLCAIWQELIDYRDKELKEIKDHKNRLNMLQRFFIKNSAQRFMDVVWKNTGLHIDEVKFVNTGCGFCTWMFMSTKSGCNQDGTFQIENILSGNFIERYWFFNIPKHFDAKTLVKIASSYDSTKGIIKPAMREEIRKLVHSMIGFDIKCGFLLEDMLPTNAGIKNFTARELTAIMLHEIGHTLTVVEHAADMYARVSSFKYLAEAFKHVNKNDANAALELGKETADALDAKGMSDQALQVRAMCARFEKDIKETGTTAVPEHKSTLILGLFASILGLLFSSVLFSFDVLLGEKSNNARLTYRGQKKKFGDIPNNIRMVTWQERKADEYAFSHGYGSDQVSALAKINGLFSRFGRSPSEVEDINEREKLRKGLTLLQKFNIIVTAPIYTGSYGSMLYPEGVKRFKEMLGLTIQQLKANSADPEYIAKYMKDIESICQSIDNYDQRDDFYAKISRGYSLLLKYISIPSFFEMLVHGKAMYEIEQLVDDIQKLGNNLIAFYGFKLQQLSKG